MRLLYASSCKPASREANAVQTMQMSAAFSNIGHEVLLTGIGGNSQTSGGYRLTLLPWPYRRLQARLMRWWIRRLISSWRPDILFTRSPLLAEVGIKEGLPTILELHTLPDAGSKTEQALLRSLNHSRLIRVVTISQALADDLVADYGHPHPGCDIAVAHDGAEPGRRPGPSHQNANAIRVGYFGHLYPGKGMELIAALAPLLPELQFDVYGGREDDIAQWRSQTAGIDNLHLHGYIPHDQVAVRMQTCNILIAPYGSRVSHVAGGDISRWISPLKLFEYMASERPIVTSDLPVLREVVVDDETVLMCSPGDTQQWVSALRRLATDSTLRARLGKAGRDLLEAEYTWNRRAQKVLGGLNLTDVSVQ